MELVRAALQNRLQAPCSPGDHDGMLQRTLTRPCLITVLLLLSILGGSACRSSEPVPGLHSSATLEQGSRFTRTELFLGLARPRGPEVTEAEWAAFLSREVTPRFPRGLTVLSARGQWLQDGRVVREPSRVLVLLHESTAETERNIEAIRAAYMRQFDQQAVLRVDAVVRVRL